MDFKEILKQLDESVKAHPELSTEQAIDLKLSELGIDEATRRNVAEACSTIDCYQAEYDSLQKAKAHGKTRDSWLEHRINQQTEKFPEEQRNVILAAIINKIKKLTAWITNS